MIGEEAPLGTGDVTNMYFVTDSAARAGMKLKGVTGRCDAWLDTLKKVVANRGGAARGQLFYFWSCAHREATSRQHSNSIPIERHIRTMCHHEEKCCAANVTLWHPSPEHEDAEFYALTPKIRGFGAGVIKGRMRNTCNILLAKATCLEIYILAR